MVDLLPADEKARREKGRARMADQGWRLLTVTTRNTQQYFLFWEKN
jgi:hypothetical protein